MKRLIGIAGLGLLFAACSASAALVSVDFSFSGIQFDDPPDGFTGAGTFRLSYDLTAPDSNPDPSVGAYDGKIMLIAGGVSTPLLDVTINVSNNVAAPGGGVFDEFGVLPITFPAGPFPIVDGHTINSGGFSVIADIVNPPTDDMLPDDKLPATTGFVGKATRALVVLGREDTDTPNSLPLDLQSFYIAPTPVPEPSTYALLLAGLMGLLWVGRARRTP
jgi:hypothetical protein